MVFSMTAIGFLYLPSSFRDAPEAQARNP